ncbi:MAG: hypothetical protein IJ668_10610, partial [Selenomonadaceae bacterium]|nr:hypothetical protein [Selenomonadaceae bacterium]
EKYSAPHNFLSRRSEEGRAPREQGAVLFFFSTPKNINPRKIFSPKNFLNRHSEEGRAPREPGAALYFFSTPKY